MAVAHRCQSGSDGASSLDLSWLGILDYSADRDNKEVAGVEVVGSKICGIPGTLCRIKAAKAVATGGGAKTNVGAGAYDDDGARAGFSIVSMSWGSTQLKGVGFKV